MVDFAHDVKACALGQASSSLMARHVIGATAEELLALRDTIDPHAEAERAAAGRKMGGFRGARAGARLSRPPRLDAPHLRRRRRRARPDRAPGARRRPRRHDRPRPRAAPGRACADPLLPAHAVEPPRPAMPLPARAARPMRTRRSPGTAFGPARGWEPRAFAAAIPGAAPDSIRLRKRFRPAPRGRGRGAYGRWRFRCD